MKLAFVLSGFPAISEPFILNQITGLLDRGHDVSIFADRPTSLHAREPELDRYELDERLSYRPTLPADGLMRVIKIALLMGRVARHPQNLPCMTYWRKNRSSVGTGSLLCAALGIGRNRIFDIIHCHYGPNGLNTALLRESGWVRGGLVTTFHGFDVSRYVRQHSPKVYEPLFSHGDLFLPISDEMKGRLTELGCPDRKIVVHRMGIDTQRFSFVSRRSAGDGRFRIVSVARLVEKKGLEFGIRAVHELLERALAVEYTIAGDGALKGSLQALIHELGDGQAIHLVGPKTQHEIKALLHNADVLLCPSVTGSDGDREGLPVSVMEAMSTGIPVVGSDHAGISEIVVEGETGRLVPERNIEVISGTLHDLIDEPARRLRMGENARARVLARHDIDALNDRLVEHYEAVLSPNRSGSPES